MRDSGGLICCEKRVAAPGEVLDGRGCWTRGNARNVDIGRPGHPHDFVPAAFCRLRDVASISCATRTVFHVGPR